MPTLFGGFENGVFKGNGNATIYLYNKNAREILGTGSAQFGAPKNVMDAITKLSQNQKNVNEKFSLPNRQAQQTDAAESVKDDAELYAQVKRDEDARAALQMLTRLHEQTTGGGENALIKKGAFEKRLPEMVRKIKDEI